MSSCILVAMGFLATRSSLSGESQPALGVGRDTVQLSSGPDRMALLQTFSLDDGLQLLGTAEREPLSPQELLAELLSLYGSVVEDVVIAAVDPSPGTGWPPVASDGIPLDVEYLKAAPLAVVLPLHPTGDRHDPPMQPPGSAGG